MSKVSEIIGGGKEKRRQTKVERGKMIAGERGIDNRRERVG